MYVIDVCDTESGASKILDMQPMFSTTQFTFLLAHNTIHLNPLEQYFKSFLLQQILTVCNRNKCNVTNGLFG